MADVSNITHMSVNKSISLDDEYRFNRVEILGVAFDPA